MKPLVSICIPTFNGARWIGDAVRSALAQQVDLELLVVDDRSTDDTLERVRGITDPRIRVVRSEQHLGLPESWNACVRHARGELIKFLFQDDLLYPECLPRMLAALGDAAVGLVFCRRDVISHDDPAATDEALRAPHQGFERLERINHGPVLFDQLLRGWFRGNWIGEPTAVLVRRACFERVGLFNPRLVQIPDLEMWARILCRFDAGFVDEPLCAFRVHRASATAVNARRARHWLDSLWLAEGLLASADVPPSPRLEALRYLGMLRAIWLRARCWQPESLTPGALGAQARGLLAYLRYRASSAEPGPGDHRQGQQPAAG